MSLRYQIDKLEDVEDVQRGFYVEKDGKFVLDAEGLPEPPPHKDNTGVMGDLVRERKLRQELDKKVKRWEALGKTPEEIDALMEEFAAQQTEIAKKKGDYDSMLKQATDRAEREKKQLNEKLANSAEEIAKRERRIETLIIDAQVNAALATHGGKPYLAKVIRDQIKIERGDDGVEKVIVLDEKGTTKLGKENKPMSIDELVSEMRGSDEYAPAFNGSGATGGGMRPGAGGGAASKIARKADLKKDGMKPEEFIKARDAWIKGHATEAEGVSAWMTLPD